MAASSFARVSAAALVSAAVLVACGGGEIVAAVAFVGSAGGDWRVDAEPAGSQPGLQQRDDCGDAEDEDCVVNIQPVGGPSLFAPNFDLTYTSNLSTCPGSGTGRVQGERITLTGCFSGRYRTINEALSDDGTLRMFFDVDAGDLDLTNGVWVEIEDEDRRFKFTEVDAGTGLVAGCEYTAAGAPAVAMTVVRSQVGNAAGPFETTIGAFTIAGRSGVWTGRFVGGSGLRLVQGDRELELERRADPANTPCP
jgi:hypothetical protein